MQDTVVRCDDCAIKSACVAPVALEEQILERVRKANRQGSESCRPEKGNVSHPHSGGVWARPPTGQPSSEEAQGPLVVCWPHTQKERKKRKRKTERRRDLSCNQGFQTRISKSRTALLNRGVPRESTTTTTTTTK